MSPLTSGWMKAMGCPLSLYIWFGISSQSGIVSTYSALIRRFHSLITCTSHTPNNQYLTRTGSPTFQSLCTVLELLWSISKDLYPLRTPSNWPNNMEVNLHHTYIMSYIHFQMEMKRLCHTNGYFTAEKSLNYSLKTPWYIKIHSFLLVHSALKVEKLSSFQSKIKEKF